jgi:1-acyl-sn-glycerol-3-phosphate acyltransferase
VFWRLRASVLVELLEQIQPGLDKDMFFEQLQREIEGATARLVAEGARELATPGAAGASTS